MRLVSCLICIAALGFLPLVAQADSTPPVASVAADSERFGDLDTAARAALDAAVRLSREFEYGGLVIKCGDTYAFTAPVTNRSTVSVRYRYAYPSTCLIAAMYHAHPTDSRWASGESAADMDARKHLGVPSYILVIRSGIVKVFE
jgi:proteasome lid subunit RPN8/RPN11